MFNHTTFKTEQQRGAGHGWTGRRRRSGWLAGLVIGGSMALMPAMAHGEVHQTGDWPNDDPAITLDLAKTPRSAAIRQLAKAAGWSIVFRGTGSDEVNLAVEAQPASKVLALLLDDADYTAERDGTLISIRRNAANLPAASPSAASPPAATHPPLAPRQARDDDGQDRTVTGDDVTIGVDEVVHDLTVTGGSVKVLGKVTGDLKVVGGSAKLGPQARIEGDVSIWGGALSLADGSTIDGDVRLVGGHMQREGGAVVAGEVVQGHAAADAETGSDSWLEGAGKAVSNTAFLFLFGTILLALLTRRMDTLQVELAARPARSFALGIVGSIAVLVGLCLLCVTVVGIPLALAAVVAVVVAGYSGICAVLTTVGSSLVHHRSTNPYVHLAVGCGLWLLLGNLPYVGGWVTFAVISAGLGAVYATRGAGLVPKKLNMGGGPYRTAAA